MSFEDALHASLGAYMKAPEWLRRGVGLAYASLPTRLRLGPRYAGFAAEARGHLQAAPWERVEAKLAATLKVAADVPALAPHANWLRDEGVPAFERLRALPLVGKADIKAEPAAWLHPGTASARRLEMFTGGSTAEPMRFYLERGVTRPRETAYIECLGERVLGAASDHWTLSLRGRSVAGAARKEGRLWTVEPIKRHLIFSSDHLEPRHMGDYVRELERLGPRLIHAFPSALYPLARWLHSHPCRTFTERVAGVLLTSESAYDYQLELIRKVFPRARVVLHYGHSERVLMALATPARYAYTFMPLYGLPELVDAQGRPIDRPGQLGEIVGTGFDNAVMPLVRYRTGDMGVWSAAPVYRKGVARYAMQRIEGRLQEFVVCADHRLISITTLGAAHFEELHRVSSIQFEQSRPGLLTLKVVSGSPLSADERERIAAAVNEKTQGGCRVDVVQVDAIERTARGKLRMLVQHLDLTSYLGNAAHAAGQREVAQTEASRFEMAA